MDYIEARKTIDQIIEDLRNNNYSVSFDEPNNIKECTAPDGRTFYKFFDMDDVKTGNYFGSCNVDVEGYTFSCDLGNGDYESDFFDELEDEYELEDGISISKDELIEEIIDAFNDQEDIYFGEYSDMDWQMDIYAKIYKIKNPEYYWCEDSDCPIDINDRWIDYKTPKELEYGTVYFNHRKYYLVEVPGKKEQTEKLHAVHCTASPDDQGRFPTVLLELSYKKKGKIRVLSCEECKDEYNAAAGYVD